MELNGTITEIIDEYSGFITDNDQSDYYFSVADFLEPIILKTGIKVIFKPVIIEEIRKAILISLEK